MDGRRASALAAIASSRPACTVAEAPATLQLEQRHLGARRTGFDIPGGLQVRWTSDPTRQRQARLSVVCLVARERRPCLPTIFTVWRALPIPPP